MDWPYRLYSGATPPFGVNKETCMEFNPENATAVVIKASCATPKDRKVQSAAVGVVVGRADAQLVAGGDPTPGLLVARADGLKGGGPHGEWWCPEWALEPVELPLGAEVIATLEDGDRVRGQVSEVRYTADGDRFMLDGENGPFGRLELELAQLATTRTDPPPGYRLPLDDGEGHIIEVTNKDGFVPLAPHELSEVNLDVTAPALNDGARYPSSLPNDSELRKQYPLYDVLFGVFPAAMVLLAHHAWKGNQKHNPGLPLQHARNKSTDHKNCILRHLAEGDYEAVLWRAAALCQEQAEKDGAPVAPLATFE